MSDIPDRKNFKTRTWFDIISNEETRAKITVVVVFLILSFFSFYTFKTSASVTEFYFESCLGKWRNPQNAEGMPSVEIGSSQDRYNLGNSAVLYSDLKEIYCGGLDKEIPTDQKLEKTTLKLAIAFSRDQLRNPEPSDLLEDTEPEENLAPDDLVDDLIDEEVPIETIPDSTDELRIEDGGKLEQVVETTNQEVPVTESSSVPTDVPVETIDESGPQTFKFIKTARAEEVEQVSETLSAAVAEPEIISNEVSSDEAVKNETDITNEEESVDSVSGIDSETIEEITGELLEEPQVIDEKIFLEIYYTLDGGKTLNLLDKISTTNWSEKNFEYEVPIDNWSDLQNFQVSVHGIEVFELQPIVYLDSAWLVVEHSLATPEEISEELVDEGVRTGLYSDVIKTETFNVLIPQDYTLDEGNELACDVNPFDQQVSRGASARFKLDISDKESPHRITFGRLPFGINMTIEEGDDVYFVVEADVEAETGSFNVSLLYEILSEGENIKQTTCQFNVVVT